MGKLAQLESGQSFILFFHEHYVQELFVLFFFSRKYQLLFCCRSSAILPDPQISKQSVPILLIGYAASIFSHFSGQQALSKPFPTTTTTFRVIDAPDI